MTLGAEALFQQCRHSGLVLDNQDLHAPALPILADAFESARIFLRRPLPEQIAASRFPLDSGVSTTTGSTVLQRTARARPALKRRQSTSTRVATTIHANISHAAAFLILPAPSGALT